MVDYYCGAKWPKTLPAEIFASVKFVNPYLSADSLMLYHIVRNFGETKLCQIW